MGVALFVTGTNTGVGKTFFSYLLCKALKESGVEVGYWKPVETGADPIPPDAKLLSELLNQPLEETVTYRFKLPLAPYVAEKYEGERIDLKTLRDIFETKLRRYEILIVEGAGGLAVPIKSNYTYADWVSQLNIPTLVVSDARLGTINCSVLTAHYGFSKGVNLKGFVFNRFTGKDLSEKDNPRVVEDMTGLPVWFEIPETTLESFKLPAERLQKLLKCLERD